MNTNVLRFSLFGIARDQEVDHTFVKFIVHSLTMIEGKIIVLSDFRRI